MSTDCFFQHVHICLRNRIFLAFFFAPFHRFEDRLIVSSTRTSNVNVIDTCIHLLGNALCTCENRSLLVQEVHPKVNTVPYWSLIGNEANHRFSLISFQLNDSTKSFRHRDAFRTESSTYIDKHSIESRIFQWMIDLCTLQLVLCPQRQ